MFNDFFYQPLLNTLIFLYQTVSFYDFGIAIILLTLLVRIVLFPLFYKGSKSQTIIQRLQPALKKIQHDHKGNREKLAQATMELYKKNKVNPFSGILLLVVQLPILFALFKLFQSLSNLPLDNLYSFVSRPEYLNPQFLHLIDLGKSNIFIVILAAIAQYFQGHLALPKIEKGKELAPAEKISRQMVLFGPFITVVFLISLPSALGLYWFATSVFSVIQQLYINKKIKMDNKKDGESEGNN